MRRTVHLRHPLAVNAEAGSAMRRCRYCAHPIRLYHHVGWVDVTTPFLGGTYDMCERGRWALHRPQDVAGDGRSGEAERRARARRRAGSGRSV
jgi:hypothetical protein